MTELESGSGFDYISQTRAAVPYCDLAAAGFECDSVSGLNVNAKQNRDCVSTSSDNTGTTAKGVVGYIRLRRPRWILLENVACLLAKNADGSSNMITLQKTLNAAGYLFWYEVMNSNRFGVPQRRDSVWILGLRVQRHGFDQLCNNFHFPEWHKQASLFMKLLERDPLDLSYFLMNNHALEEVWPRAARMALAAKRSWRGATEEESQSKGKVIGEGGSKGQGHSRMAQSTSRALQVRRHRVALRSQRARPELLLQGIIPTSEAARGGILLHEEAGARDARDDPRHQPVPPVGE